MGLARRAQMPDAGVALLTRSLSSCMKPVPVYEGLPTTWTILGGAGNLGAVLVDHLLDAGAQSVKVLDLRPYAGKHAGSTKVTSIVGSITDRAIVDEAVAGANTVVCAVTPNLPTATWNQFVAVNVFGAQTALNAAAASPSARAFVHISSMAIHNHNVAHVNAPDDLKPPDLMSYTSAYDLTKRLGEELVLQANADAVAGKRPLRTVALRPGGILIGPGDYTLQGMFKDGIAYMEGEPIDFTYGRNVCHAVCLAAAALQDGSCPAAGKAITVTKGKAVTLGTLTRDMGARLGRKFPVLPSIVLRLVGIASVFTHAWRNERDPRGAPAIPTHRFLAQANVEQTHECTKASTLLGFTPLYTYDETLDAIVADHVLSIPVAAATRLIAGRGSEGQMARDGIVRGALRDASYLGSTRHVRRLFSDCYGSEETAVAAAAVRVAAAAVDGVSLPVCLAMNLVRFVHDVSGRDRPAGGGVVSASFLNAKPAVGGIGVEPRRGGVLRVLFTVASDAVADTVVRSRRNLRDVDPSAAVFDVLSDREEAQHRALWPAFLAAKAAGKRAQFHRARLVVDGERVPAPAC
ncbi:hypothetical protein FOA52_008242 [Chlamydomonas sp. UWO 241]|nr:hypothetical protein FOA52_008242 [Chlamydomonas sp. UWO 241]